MGALEIVIIVVCALIVVGTIVGTIVRKKKKGAYSCCGDCSCCKQCPSGEDELNKSKQPNDADKGI